MKISSETLAEVVQSKHKILQPDKIWKHVHTDSRTQAKSAVFIAIAGENFDGHDFVKQAVENGCEGLLVHKDVSSFFKPEELSKIQIFMVEDTLMALQKLAHYVGRQHAMCMKVALTGTSGKTSTKYFAHQILQDIYPHYFSPKSFNNHIGVPLSLLEIGEKDKMALLEVGMNHPGEIKNLIEIIEPDVCLVTMVGRGHLEGLGSIDDVLKEKMSIFQMGKSHIINLDDRKIVNFYQQHFAESDATRFNVSALDPSADIYLEVIEDNFADFKIQGHIMGVEGEATIPIAGAHHITNVLMAAAVALHSDLVPEDIWKRLANLRSFWGRSEVLKSKSKVNFYFDAYNANPESMNAFLKQLKKLRKPPYVILGQMLELGESSSDLHYELGVEAAQSYHDKIWFYGPSAADFERGYLTRGNKNNLMISDTYKEDIALKYKSMLKTDDWIALKGSRGMRLEAFLSLFEF